MNRTSFRMGSGKVAVAIAGVAVLGGCSDAQAPRESAAHQEIPTGAQGSSLVRALGARFARAGHPFFPASRPDSLARTEAGWRAEFARLPSPAARRADVTVAHHAAGALVVTDASSGLSLRAELSGATSNEGVEDQGYVVYRGGHETGADVLIRADAEGAEDYLHFEKKPARESITYRVGLRGVAGLRLVADTLELLDGSGTPRLRMAPPVGLDARGNEVRPEVAVEGCAFDSNPAAPWDRPVTSPGAASCEVTLRWGLAAEAYPLLLDPGWSTTGSMATARASHAIATLGSGKVLVAGGRLIEGTTVHKTAELFDPTTGTWAATGTMANARYSVNGLVLGSGKVLVAGGCNNSANTTGTTSAEVYNPTAGTWASAGSLAVARWAYPLVLLSSGEALAMAGRTPGNTLTTAEKYNPTTNSWSAVASMVNKRFSHTATVLTGGPKIGQVLVAGGTFAQPITSVEIYNPANNTWSAGPSMLTARVSHEANLTTAAGQVLVTGGQDASFTTIASAEMYNPATNTWLPVPSLGTARHSHTATTLSNGGVLVVGGSGSSSPLAKTEQGNSSDGWLNAGDLAGNRTFHRASLLLDGRVLVTGGVKSTTSIKTAEIFSLGAEGGACSQAGQCASRSCVDGVCCNSSCSETNKACVQSLTGKPDGQCGLVVNGASCSTGADCGSGFCVDGYCCNSACNAPLACSQAKTGKSNGTCGKLINGLGCSNDSTCNSGFCTDGVCCSARCNGLCESCLQVHTGVTQGVCAPIPNDNDPENECDPTGSGICALQGVCNGQRSCKNIQGTPCAQSTCVNGTYTPPSFCNAAGTCSVPASSTCGQYACLDATQCRTSCTQDAHCTSGTQCINGNCGLGKGNGASCAQNDECTSKSCVDGVCCSSACTEACFSCKGVETGGTSGVCLPVKVGTDPGNDCSSAGTACGADGFCDGKGACNGNVTAGVSCGSPTCAGLVVVSQLCDGKGVCSPVQSPPCPGGYICQSGQCLTSCANDTSCAAGSYCAAGSCAPKQDNGAPCSGDNQCSSAHCTEGLCCDSACSGPCQSCVGLNTQGGVNGKCDSIKDGIDPKNACDKDASNTCGADGLCGADGQCRSFAPDSTSCGGTICAGTAAVSGQLCDGSGACIAAGATPCSGGYTCAAGACLLACGADTDCINGHFCDKGKCATLRGNGAVCTTDGQCESGHCVDGVCCDTLCDGGCQSCRGINTVNGVDGTCGEVKAGTDPRSACAADDQNPCGADGTCTEGGQCRAFASEGTFCGSSVCKGTEISTQTCDGSGACIAVNASPCPAGYTCQDSACPGTCTDDAGCVPGFFCKSGSCNAVLQDGATCSKNTQCSSGFCTEGLCCDSACSGPCQSCVGLNTQGGVNGKCDSIKDGIDPKNACDKDASNTCGADGLCGADGQCRSFAPDSTSCGGGTICAGTAAVSGQLCDGSGACIAVGATPCSGGYTCVAGACLLACGTDADCINGHFCDKGKCATLQGQGATCKADSQCESGHCVDGVCCDTLCDGGCQSCRGINTVNGVDGTCGEVKAGTDPRSACAADDQNPCGADGTCTEGGQCAKVVAKDTPCGSDSCVAESLVAKVCDGFGVCKSKTKQACSPYACDDNAGSCKAKCLTNADCAAGAECNSSKQECAVSGSTCVDQFTVQSSTGQKTACAPYSCLNGACKTTCASDAECADGFACSSGTCSPSAGAGGASGSTGAAGSLAGGQGQGAGGASAGGSSGVGGAPAGAPPNSEGSAEQSGGCALPRRPSSPAPALWFVALAATVARRKRARAARPAA